MLNFLPVLLIIISLLILLVLQRTRTPIGTVWLILAGLTSLNWGALLLLRSRLPQPLVIANWFPGTFAGDLLTFRIDANSWFLMFALASLLVGILFSSAGHLHEPHITNDLIEVMGLTAVGMLALLAGSAVSFLLVWALIDIVEIIAFTLLNRDETLKVQTYAIFIGRALGLVLVLWAIALAAQSQTPLDLGKADGAVLTLLIAGAGLRLGVLPFHLPYTQEMTERRNLGTILRMLAPLSAFAFLAQLAVPATFTGWQVLILLFALLGCVMGAVNWFTAKDELVGRPYWLLAFSGFAFLSYFHGQAQSVIVWGVLMVVVGGWIFLSEYPSGKIDFLLVVAGIDLVGLPFTPGAAGIAGISKGPFSTLNVVLWVSLALILAGVIRLSLKTKDTTLLTENWMRLFYSLGMGMLVISPWVILLFKLNGWNDFQYWWVALFSLFIVAAIVVLTYFSKISGWFQKTSIFQTLHSFLPFGQVVNRFFHFEWLYRLLSFLFRVQQRIIAGFNLILEGEGGILWALVFLALLVSLLVSGGLGNG